MVCTYILFVKNNVFMMSTVYIYFWTYILYFEFDMYNLQSVHYICMHNVHKSSFIMHIYIFFKRYTCMFFHRPMSKRKIWNIRCFLTVFSANLQRAVGTVDCLTSRRPMMEVIRTDVMRGAFGNLEWLGMCFFWALIKNSGGSGCIGDYFTQLYGCFRKSY